MAIEYFSYAKKYPPKPKMIKAHIMKFFYKEVKTQEELLN